MKVVEINDSNISEKIKESKKVVIDCYAPWCGPCKMLSPIIDELANEKEEIVFYKLNTDSNEQTAVKYSIMSIPTILCFENGELKQRIIGYKSKEELNEIIK